METIKEFKTTCKLFNSYKYWSLGYKISAYTTYCLFFFILFLLIITSSCTPRKVKEVLGIAEDNRSELEKVIAHYRNAGDKEKLKAAYFLIGNMANKYSTIWLNRDKYGELYRFIDSTKAGNSPALAKWDTLKRKLGVKTKKYSDAENIKASLLIENIDLAFDAWHKMPWGKFYNFDQFCEYILPYRVDDEPLENWRPFFRKEMKWVMDSLQNKNDIRQTCKYINDWVHRHHRLLVTLGEVPKLGSIDAFYHPAGICEHRLILIVSILRTFGIPCAIDYTPQYTNWPGGHPWIALIDTTGKTVSFSGGDILKYSKTNKMPMGFGQWGATKIYRYTYSYDLNFFKKVTYNTLFTKPCIDVTEQYDMKRSTVSFMLNDGKQKDVFLCTFGSQSKIVAVAYTKASSRKVEFKNVGLDALYFPAFFKDDELIPLQNPTQFDYAEIGSIYNPLLSNYQKIILTNKCPDDGLMLKNGKGLLGSVIEGSVDRAFSKSVLLHKIDTIPFHFVDIYINNHHPFRYIKFTTGDSGHLRLAEFEVHSEKGKLVGKITGKKLVKKGNKDIIDTIPMVDLAKAIDGNPATALVGPAKSWFILDFGNSYSIKKIKYVQYSRANYVQIGDLYELFYFDLGWHSLGQKYATESYLIFDKVPKKALLLLSDLTEGKDERIFIYKKGEQVFY